MGLLSLVRVTVAGQRLVALPYPKGGTPPLIMHPWGGLPRDPGQ